MDLFLVHQLPEAQTTNLETNFYEKYLNEMLPIYTTDYYQNFVVKFKSGSSRLHMIYNDSVRMMDSLPLDHWIPRDVELRKIPHPYQ